MPTDGAPRTVSAWTGWLIAPAFLALAFWMYSGADFVELPETPATHVDPAELNIEPLRRPLTDPPTIFLAGFDQTCNSCHQLFPPAENDGAARERLQHQHIKLNHGINNRCRNCHSRGDRNKLVMRNGWRIPYSRVVDLCSNCHGPTYRDWLRGMHGRTNGYWNAELGESKRLTCTSCHEPHNPRYPAMDRLRPLPGPRTLRAEARPGHVSAAEEPDPLRRILLPEGESHEPPARIEP